MTTDPGYCIVMPSNSTQTDYILVKDNKNDCWLGIVIKEDRNDNTERTE